MIFVADKHGMLTGQLGGPGEIVWSDCTKRFVKLRFG